MTTANKKWLFPFIFLSLVCSPGNWPSPHPPRTVHGIVKDDRGTLLNNTEIMIDDTRASTDQDGYFNVTIPVHWSNWRCMLRAFPYAPLSFDPRDYDAEALPDTFRLFLPWSLHAYRSQLLTARDKAYTILPVEAWIPGSEGLEQEKVIILRHDVDYDTLTAKAIGFIEHQLDVCSTFYFRWITADTGVIAYLRKMGHHIGFHYETLAYYCEEHDIYDCAGVTDDVLESCRSRLKQEILDFTERFGDIRSISSHGAERNRILGISNAVLIHGQNIDEFGVSISATMMEWYPGNIEIFVADSGGRWSPMSFLDALDSNMNPIYVLMHPCWWRPPDWPEPEIVRL